MEKRHRHHVELYRDARKSLNQYVQDLHVDEIAVIELELRIMRAVTASYNLGFIDGVMTHDEYEAQVARDNEQWPHE